MKKLDQESRRDLRIALLVATAVALYLPAIWWGLPQADAPGKTRPWGSDEIGPTLVQQVFRVDFQGSRVTSDGGLLLVRELDERLGLTGLIQNYLVDSRTGRNTQCPYRSAFHDPGTEENVASVPSPFRESPGTLSLDIQG